MAGEEVDYVKNAVESDLASNRRLCDKDFSVELGTLLHMYLTVADNSMAAVSLGASGLGALEQQVAKETGKAAMFYKSKICGLPIHKLWKKGDKEGLAEIAAYASQLMGKVEQQH